MSGTLIFESGNGSTFTTSNMYFMWRGGSGLISYSPTPQMFSPLGNDNTYFVYIPVGTTYLVVTNDEAVMKIDIKVTLASRNDSGTRGNPKFSLGFSGVKIA